MVIFDLTQTHSISTQFQDTIIYIYCLLKDKKSAQKVLSKDLVHKKTFRLSSRTPQLYDKRSVQILNDENLQVFLYPGKH